MPQSSANPTLPCNQMVTSFEAKSNKLQAAAKILAEQAQQMSTVLQSYEQSLSEVNKSLLNNGEINWANFLQQSLAFAMTVNKFSMGTVVYHNTIAHFLDVFKNEFLGPVM